MVSADSRSAAIIAALAPDDAACKKTPLRRATTAQGRTMLHSRYEANPGGSRTRNWARLRRLPAGTHRCSSLLDLFLHAALSDQLRSFLAGSMTGGRIDTLVELVHPLGSAKVGHGERDLAKVSQCRCNYARDEYL
jgi:hypothetical protein